MSQLNRGPSNLAVIGFIVCLSFACALILSMLASALRAPQATARELDRSEQMLISARIYHPDGYFQMKDTEGQYVPAKHAGNGILEAGTVDDTAGADDVLTVYRKRIRAILIDPQGKMTSFKDADLDEMTYTAENAKFGYANLPLKLAYEILPNPTEGQSDKPDGYVIPVNGFGLWDAIYGYLAIAPDGDNVIGVSWYDHKETPGLGAVISETGWQNQFPGKRIFKSDGGPSADLARTPLGITVVRGKVVEVLGDGPKSLTAVDGIPGATLTGNGVSKAYSDVLEQYRPFLISLQRAANNNS